MRMTGAGSGGSPGGSNRASIGCWLRTVRHLRMRQALGQLRTRLAPWIDRPERFARRTSAPAWPGLRWTPRRPFLAAGAQSDSPGSVLGGELEMAGQRRRVGWPPDWRPEETTRLWRYHLHYLEQLWALDFDDAATLARHWIRRHRLGRDREGWEPYPTSLRLSNLCGVFFGRHREMTLASPALRDDLWASIHLQAEWLRGHLETHLLGNHLLENGVALAAVGSCFAGSEAARWRREGLRILRRELPEQVLPDGGHCERSPMYQTRVAWALAFLDNCGDHEVEACVRPALERCLGALRLLCHPDGQIALLNDSALNLTNPAAEVLGYAAGAAADHPAMGPFALPETGYFGAATARGDYVVVDAGLVGPDYQPGHAHADLFSFELSLGGERVVVDSGNYDYEPSPQRAYCRSTRAHNTVEVDGQSQCELWGVFRVGRRARPHDVTVRRSAAGFVLSAWHDGYQHLPGAPRHRRELAWHDSGAVAVRDTVSATRAVATASRLHLHPGCRIVALDGRRAVVETAAQSVTILFAGRGELRRQTSLYCPRFGVARERQVLVFEIGSDRGRSGFLISRTGAAASFDLESGARIGELGIGW